MISATDCGTVSTNDYLRIQVVSKKHIQSIAFSNQKCSGGSLSPLGSLLATDGSKAVVLVSFSY